MAQKKDINSSSDFINESALVYSPQQAARIICCGYSTLYKMMSEGKIKAFKMGRRTVISKVELERYLASLPVAEFNA